MVAFRYRFILFVINTSAFEYSCCSLHGQEEKKISKCHWHFCCSHHVRYFQRNDWSKPAISSISLDSLESKVTCVFLQSYFTCIVCISRDHLSWFAQPHGVYVYMFVLWHMINVGFAVACPSSSVFLVDPLFYFSLLLFTLTLSFNLFFQSFFFLFTPFEIKITNEISVIYLLFLDSNGI